MVEIKTLNVTMSKETWDACQEIKNNRDLTWREFIEKAVDCLQSESSE